MNGVPLPVVERLAELILAALRGAVPTVVDIARALLGIALDFVPVDELRTYLDEEARARVDRQVDAIVTAKFGPRDSD